MADTSELAAVGADLSKAAGAVGAKAAAVVRKSTLDIEAETKRQIIAMDAVDTGNMLNSVSSTIRGDGRFSTIEGEVGPTAEYSGYVHDGTSRMAGRPFLATAADMHIPTFEAAMGQIGGKIL